MGKAPGAASSSVRDSFCVAQFDHCCKRGVGSPDLKRLPVRKHLAWLALSEASPFPLGNHTSYRLHSGADTDSEDSTSRKGGGCSQGGDY